MSWKRVFRRRRWDAERASEIETYIQMEIDDNIGRGLAPDEARNAARRKFGNTARVREDIYRMNSIGLLENLCRDVTYALRSLRQSPGFTAVAVLSLALGIGANTAIFSLVDTLMLKSLPVQRPHELVQLSMFSTDPPPPGKTQRGSNSFSYPIFEEIRDGASVFAGIFAHGGASSHNIRIDGREERITSERATGDYFATLGVTSVLGRTFTSEQDRPGAPGVAVISYGYWERRFGRDPAVIGRTFSVGPIVFTIIGVGPPGFTGIGVDRITDIWVPYTAATPADRLWGPRARQNWSPHIVARLKPGLSPAQAEAPLNVLFSQILENDVAYHRSRDTARRIEESTYRGMLARKVVLMPGGRGISSLRRQYTEPLTVLLTVVGLVLLIACANIANLLLARATTRKREVAVRLAIGAGRPRLVLQFLTESLMLSFAGAGAGLLFAFWAGQALVGLVVAPGSADVTFHVDSRVLGFTAGVAVLTTMLFGLGPALRATRVNLTPALKNEAAGGAGRMPVSKLLVVTQVALSLTLVLGAVLFVATLQKLTYQDLGFRADSLVIAGFAFDDAVKGASLTAAQRDLLDRARGLPGVQSATLSQYAALSGSGWSEPVYAETPDKAPERSLLQFVAPNFFDTLRMPIMQGRIFTARDDASAAKVVIVNETLARKLYPDGSAVGKRLGWTPQTRSDVEIVGVVKDARYSSNLRDPAPAFAYLPMWQPQTSPYGEANGRGTLQIRVQSDPASWAEPVRRIMKEARAQPGLIRTQDSIVADSMKLERLLAKISGFFGGVGLLLAAVGLYGMMAYTVSRRTSEMGIRMALGAKPHDVIRMVLRESTVLVVAGVAVGTAAAMAALRLIESFLFGVTRTDPAMIALAAAMLMGVGMVAAWLPALRASKVSPMSALRHE